MYVGQIITADSANGPGIRVSVFVSGCTNKCSGCFQPQTWDFDYGHPYTRRVENYILDEVSKPYYAGLTLLGGEPLEPQNQEMVLHLIRNFKKLCPDKNIWLYTGFTYENEVQPDGAKYTEYTDEILDSIDVMVDGKFEADKKDLMLKFRGSSNQRIIDMRATRKNNEVVLLEI